MPLLEIRNLTVSFDTSVGLFHAVQGIDLTIDPREVLAIVGESGSGKSVEMLAVMGLLPPSATVTADKLEFDGKDMLSMSRAEKRKIVGRDIAMIFQEPMTSLNPVLTVGSQIAESVEIHLGSDRNAAMTRARQLLELVEIPAARQRLADYPHQMSGGMRQRVMIAMALACDPLLLIADEPTTALDVTIQAQILELLAEMKSRFGMAIMLITHAMGVVAETCQRVVVMYAGKVIEEAPVDALFANPRHPYTQGLIRSIPRIDLDSAHKTRLEAIGGSVPILINPAPGCRFAPRCRFAFAPCSVKEPVLREVAPGHRMACHLGETQGASA